MKAGVLEHLQSVTGALDLTGTPYRLIRPIGRGGMGAVYLIEDTRLRREVALKVLDTPGDEGFAARLELEARIIARLEHPAIVPVHDVGRLADGRAYYVMKFVRGEPLDTWAERTHPIPALLRVFARICEAVAFAHAQGVVHRDLKPQNVMIGEYGEALVMDWGLARELGQLRSPSEAPPSTPQETADTIPAGRAANTLPGAVFGTPGFMAPEQVRGLTEQVDARADVFALGSILYFLLARRLPFEASTMKEVFRLTLDEQPAPIGKEVPRPLVSVCGRALQKDPAARYPNAGALAGDVAAWLDGLPVSAHRESLGERLGRWYRKYQVLVLLIVAYLVMRTVVALIAGR